MTLQPLPKRKAIEADSEVTRKLAPETAWQLEECTCYDAYSDRTC